MIALPWWVLLLLAVFAALTFGGVREDLADGTSRWLIALDVVGSGILVVLALAYWIDPVAELTRPSALALLAAAAATTITEVARDLSTVTASAREKLLAVGMLALVEGPLYYWGALFAVFGITRS